MTTIQDNVSVLVALQQRVTAAEAVPPVKPIRNDGIIRAIQSGASKAPQRRQREATRAYTVDVNGDFGQYLRMHTNATSVTVHAGSTASIGAEIQVRNTNKPGTLIRMVPAAGVTLNGPDRIDGQESIVIKKVAANEFDLIGGRAPLAPFDRHLNRQHPLLRAAVGLGARIQGAIGWLADLLPTPVPTIPA